MKATRRELLIEKESDSLRMSIVLETVCVLLRVERVDSLHLVGQHHYQSLEKSVRQIEDNCGTHCNL